MKTKAIIFSYLFLFLCMPLISQASSTVTLEHKFDGYYYPYNFKLYNQTDDDHYFYCPIISPDGGKISLKTYNEDYSLRDTYNVLYSIPSGYKEYSISFSSSLQLADGTPFFIVVFNSSSTSYGSANYAIAKMYNASTGQLIADLAGATLGISPLTAIYLINGKPSLVIVYNDYDSSSSSYTYTTRIYSLGTPSSNDIERIEQEYTSPEPIQTYDLNGRIINQPIPGCPFIEQMSDGSSKIRIAK